MRKSVILSIAILCSFSFLKAQSSDPEADYIKKTYSKDKQTIVSEYMNLSGQDSVKFWPVYANYEASRQKLAVVRIDLINQYVNGYDNLTAAQADMLVRSSFDNTIALDKLNSDYYGKMKNAVGAINAAKCLQLEIFLQTMWKAIVQSNIPLIGQLDKSKQN
jgi:hypothetical protein